MVVSLLRSIRASRLIRRDRPLESTWEIIGWWEARRIPFNLIVGATGVTTSISILLMSFAYEQISRVPVQWPDPPIFMIVPVIMFAVMANVCYTGGWIVELLIRRAWPDEMSGLGTVSLALGITFAVIVTLLPIPLFALLIGLTYLLDLAARH